MKGLQVIEGVPHTHGRRSNRQRPKGLKIDHRRTSTIVALTIPVAHHCAVTISLLFFRVLSLQSLSWL